MCGGPFLNSNLEDYFDAYAGVMVPAFGIEVWCNLPGQYIFFTTTEFKAVSVCDIGVFGTVFVRDEPLAEAFEIRAQEVSGIEIPHIYPEVPLGNVLAISLREMSGTEHTFVDFSRDAASSFVIIDTAEHAEGDTFILTLESFDANSNADEPAVLRTDEIFIIITEALIVETVDEEPEATVETAEVIVVAEAKPFSIVPGVESEWKVPVYDNVDPSDEIIRMEPFISPALADVLTFNESTATFKYNGGPLPAELDNKMIVLVDIGLTVFTKRYQEKGKQFTKQLVRVQDNHE